MGDVRDLSSARSARRPTADHLLSLRSEPRAPRMARHWVMRAAAAAGIGGTTNQLIEVLTGELVSEAVRQGETDALVSVGLQIYDAGVRVAVTGMWVPAHPRSMSLALVEQLSSAWGTSPGPEGERTVWFDLDITG